MKRFCTVVFCVAFLDISSSCFAQIQDVQDVQTAHDVQGTQQNIEHNIYDFQRGEKIIFSDDFSEDMAGSFPSKWQWVGDGAAHSSEDCQVQKKEGDLVLLTGGAGSDIEPKMNGEPYLTDSFTLEYDIMFGSPETSCNIDFRVKHAGNGSFDWFSINGNGEVSYLNINIAGKQSANYPGKFECNVWHHLAISNKNGIFKLYVDRYNLLNTSIYYGFSLLSFGLHCTPHVAYKNIALATGGKKNNTATGKQPDKPLVASLQIFPNTDQRSFTLNISSAIKENALVTITNMAGEKIKALMTTTNKNTEIKLDVSPGIYCISAVTKNKTLTAKVALE